LTNFLTNFLSLILLLSPSKSLRELPLRRNDSPSQPRLLHESIKLLLLAQGLDRVALMELMHISEKIADLNVARFAAWQLPFTPENAQPAIFAFTGDVYQGMQPEAWSVNDAAFAQNHVRILSGLYGILRPLDLIQAYRLEMGIALRNERGSNLYHFWKQILPPLLGSDLAEQGDAVVLNLASEEYFKAIDTKNLAGKVYNIDFKELRNHKYRVISFSAKRARGMMANYIVKNRLNTIASLYGFNEDNYQGTSIN
jgi:uncharacterized protein